MHLHFLYAIRSPMRPNFSRFRVSSAATAAPAVAGNKEPPHAACPMSPRPRPFASSRGRQGMERSETIRRQCQELAAVEDPEHQNGAAIVRVLEGVRAL